MRQRTVAAAELIAVVACVIGAWAGWHHGVRTTWFPPSADFPGFHSTYYAGGWIVLATVLVVLACVAAFDAIRRLRTSSA
jgi:cytochrome oxidase assembly protein ShyY1